MKHQIINLVCKTLKASSAVKALVDMRIYQEGLASKLIDQDKDNTVYPCITVELDSNENHGGMDEINSGMLIINCISKQGYVQANKIWDAIHPLLQSKLLSDDNYNITTSRDFQKNGDNSVDITMEPKTYRASGRLSIVTFEK